MSTSLARLLVAGSLALGALASGGCLLPGGPIFPQPPDDEEDSAPWLAQADDADEPPPPEALPPKTALTKPEAEQRLSPYGRWADTPDYGRVWIPAGVGADFQPYADGRWVWTDLGWSFVSDLAWGDIAYHYGSWGFGLDLGWYWVPDYLWGPAWVFWRWAPGYACWSPRGPRGYRYGHHWRGWVTVPARTLGRPIGPHRLARPGGIVRASRPVQGLGRTGSWSHGGLRRGGWPGAGHPGGGGGGRGAGPGAGHPGGGHFGGGGHGGGGGGHGGGGGGGHGGGGGGGGHRGK